MRLRRVRDGLLVASIAGALPGAAGATTAPSPTPARQRADARVLVRFARPSDAAPALAATGATGGDAIGEGYRVVQIPAGRTRAQTLAALRAQPGVVSAQPDALVTAQGVPPNDPDFAEQWALDNTGQSPHGLPATPGADVGALSAWDAVMPAQLNPITVAVLDTGVRADHPDLAGSVLPGPDLVGGDPDPDDSNDDNGHGTQVAGIIAAGANDGGGIAGLARGVKILSVKVLDRTGHGDIGQVIGGMEWAADHGARIVNLSLGLQGAVPDAFTDVVASHPDVLFVLAAGNFGADGPSQLCITPLTNVLCVTATDEADQVPPWASVGAPAVGLAAPGVDVVGDSLRTTTTPLDLDHASAWTLDAGWSVGGGHLRFSNHGALPPSYGQAAMPATAIPIPAAERCDLDYDVRATFSYGYGISGYTPSSGAVVRGGWGQDGKQSGGFQDVVDDPAPSGPGRSITPSFNATGDDHSAATGDVDITNLRLVCGDPAQAPRASDVQELTGTSASAPLTAATAALVLGATPDARPEDLVAKLECGVDPVTGLGGQATVSGGRLSAAGALAAQLGARTTSPVGRVTTLATALDPIYLAGAPDGSVVFTDHGNSTSPGSGWSLKRLRPDGTIQTLYQPSGDDQVIFGGLAVSQSDGSIWLVRNGVLERIDPQGAMHDVLTFPADDPPYDATLYADADADGSVLVAHEDPGHPRLGYQAVERIDRAGHVTPIAGGFPWIDTITRDEHGDLLVGATHTSYELPPADGIWRSEIDRVAADGSKTTIMTAPRAYGTGPLGAADGHFWADLSTFVWHDGHAILFDGGRLLSIAPGGVLAPFAGNGSTVNALTEGARVQGSLGPDWSFRAPSRVPAQVATLPDGSLVVVDEDQLERIGTEDVEYPNPVAPCAGKAAPSGDGGASTPGGGSAGAGGVQPSTPSPAPAGPRPVVVAGSGAKAPARPRVALTIHATLVHLRGGALREVLRITGTRGAHVTLTCSGGPAAHCPRTLPHTTLTSTTKARTLTVSGLRAGATLTVRATASGRTTRYARVRITAHRRLAATTTGCLDTRGRAERCPAA